MTRPGPDEPSFSEDEAATRKHTPPRDDEPTIERDIPDAVAAAARDEEFRTGRVTFEEILARVASNTPPAVVPAVRDHLYTTASEPAADDEEAHSTEQVDEAWGTDEG